MFHRIVSWSQFFESFTNVSHELKWLIIYEHFHSQLAKYPRKCFNGLAPGEEEDYPREKGATKSRPNCGEKRPNCGEKRPNGGKNRPIGSRCRRLLLLTLNVCPSSFPPMILKPQASLVEPRVRTRSWSTLTISASSFATGDFQSGKRRLLRRRSTWTADWKWEGRRRRRRRRRRDNLASGVSSATGLANFVHLFGQLFEVVGVLRSRLVRFTW